MLTLAAKYTFSKFIYYFHVFVKIEQHYHLVIVSDVILTNELSQSALSTCSQTKPTNHLQFDLIFLFLN